MGVSGKKKEIRGFRKDCVIYGSCRIKGPRKSAARRRYFSESLDDGSGRVPAEWEKFVLDLSFLGWIIVGSLCLGVGTLWVTPYMEAANAQFYEYVRTCPSVAEG